MKRTVSLGCSCGAVTGTARDVSRTSGCRLSCMCDDCQAYAHYLGRADDILDEWGGTDVFQVTPAQVSLATGHQNVRCVQLTASGILRWYAGCCNTPIAHTVTSPRVPFVGLPHTFMRHSEAFPTRDDVLGPIRARIRGRHATGPLPPNAYRGVPLRAALRAYTLLLWAWLTRRYTPTPFFDLHSGQPVTSPQVLSPAQRKALHDQVVRTQRPTPTA